MLGYLAYLLTDLFHGAGFSIFTFRVKLLTFAISISAMHIKVDVYYIDASWTSANAI